MKLNRQQFLDDLRHLATLEIPWLHQGDNPEVGFDCIGVLKYTAELQVKLPDELVKEFAAYHRPPNGNHLLATMRKWFVEIDPKDRQPADLIQCFVRRNPCHMAVEMGDGLIAEAFENTTGVSRFMIWPLPSDRRIAACFRIPDEF